jgi:hypothetical protein
MLRTFLRMFGFRVIRHSLYGSEKKPPLLDIGLGIALLRDRRVPFAAKAKSIMLGALTVAAFLALQLPLDAAILLLLNVAGLGINAVMDGLQVWLGTILFGALYLSRLAPRELAERVREERSPTPAYARAARTH